MDHFTGLDVSVKETSICVVDDTGRIVREVKVASEPVALLSVLTNPGYHFKRIGLEAGPLSQWLFSALAEAGLPMICVETRHMRAVLKAQINKTDRNDARGMAQMMRVGLYRPQSAQGRTQHSHQPVGPVYRQRQLDQGLIRRTIMKLFFLFSIGSVLLAQTVPVTRQPAPQTPNPPRPAETLPRFPGLAKKPAQPYPASVSLRRLYPKTSNRAPMCRCPRPPRRPFSPASSGDRRLTLQPLARMAASFIPTAPACPPWCAPPCAFASSRGSLAKKSWASHALVTQ